MIVVDTNIITYLHLPTQYTEQAEQLLLKHPNWAAPYLWRSEFRNVLALYLRKHLISYEKAVQIQRAAENMMQAHEYTVPSNSILTLVNNSPCSAYDCEYIALAENLDTQFVTQDKKLLHTFPQRAYSLADMLK